MKIQRYTVIGTIAAALVGVAPGFSASIPNAPEAPSAVVITVLPAHGSNSPVNLTPADLKVMTGKNPAPVVRLQRLSGDLADMQLFVLLDDSTRSSSLSLQLPELKKFVESLPASTQVGIGYMRNGTFGLVQDFTADHEKAASTLRLPEAIPGGNGSPYFALSDLAKHWPSKQPTDRRAVLMLTDGVDRYYDTASIDDPYVNAAVQDALKENVMVYSIYLRGVGDSRSGWGVNFAQSRLLEVSQETGGNAYFQNFSDPVSIAPFLSDFQERLNNQYQVTIEALSQKGIQPLKLRTELPGVKIQGPTQIYLR